MENNRMSNLLTVCMRWWTLVCKCKQCVSDSGTVRRNLLHFHIYTFYFASKDWKKTTALLYVAVYSWRQTNMAGKDSSKGEPLPEQWAEQNHPNKSKDMAEWISLAEDPNWQHFKTGKKFFLKRSLNLAVILYIFIRVNS